MSGRGGYRDGNADRERGICGVRCVMVVVTVIVMVMVVVLECECECGDLRVRV